jgi:hypothetical protein
MDGTQAYEDVHYKSSLAIVADTILGDLRIDSMVSLVPTPKPEGVITREELETRNTVTLLKTVGLRTLVRPSTRMNTPTHQEVQ